MPLTGQIVDEYLRTRIRAYGSCGVRAFWDTDIWAMRQMLVELYAQINDVEVRKPLIERAADLWELTGWSLYWEPECSLHMANAPALEYIEDWLRKTIDILQDFSDRLPNVAGAEKVDEARRSLQEVTYQYLLQLAVLVEAHMERPTEVSVSLVRALNETHLHLIITLLGPAGEQLCDGYNLVADTVNVYIKMAATESKGKPN